MKQPRNTLKRLAARLNVRERIRVLQHIHSDERGGVSIETVLIIAAIALPILIFIIKLGWPRMQRFFNDNMDTLDPNGVGTSGGSGSGS